MEQPSALTPVGTFEEGKSPYGIYDMAGNVWEWVSDWYDPDYYKTSPSQNPTGPPRGEYKVIRGGSWGSGPESLRSADREIHVPSFRASAPGSGVRRRRKVLGLALVLYRGFWSYYPGLSVYLVSLVQPNKQDKPDKPIKRERPDRPDNDFLMLVMCVDFGNVGSLRLTPSWRVR